MVLLKPVLPFGDGPDLTVTEQKQVEDWEPPNLQSSAGLIVQSLEHVGCVSPSTRHVA